MSTDWRPTLKCCVEDCSSTWYEFSGGDHARSIRRAIQSGWTGDDTRTGCLCGNEKQWCPEHRSGDEGVDSRALS